MCLNFLRLFLILKLQMPRNLFFLLHNREEKTIEQIISCAFGNPVVAKWLDDGWSKWEMGWSKWDMVLK